MDKNINEEKTNQQRSCYAVKACYMMGFSREKCARALNMDVSDVGMIYWMISENMIDFESGKF